MYTQCIHGGEYLNSLGLKYALHSTDMCVDHHMCPAKINIAFIW